MNDVVKSLNDEGKRDYNLLDKPNPKIQVKTGLVGAGIAFPIAFGVAALGGGTPIASTAATTTAINLVNTLVTRDKNRKQNIKDIRKKDNNLAEKLDIMDKLENVINAEIGWKYESEKLSVGDSNSKFSKAQNKKASDSLNASVDIYKKIANNEIKYGKDYLLETTHDEDTGRWYNIYDPKTKKSLYKVNR